MLTRRDYLTFTTHNKRDRSILIIRFTRIVPAIIRFKFDLKRLLLDCKLHEK